MDVSERNASLFRGRGSSPSSSSWLPSDSRNRLISATLRRSSLRRNCPSSESSPGGSITGLRSLPSVSPTAVAKHCIRSGLIEPSIFPRMIALRSARIAVGRLVSRSRGLHHLVVRAQHAAQQPQTPARHVTAAAARKESSSASACSAGRVLQARQQFLPRIARRNLKSNRLRHLVSPARSCTRVPTAGHLLARSRFPL